MQPRAIILGVALAFAVGLVATNATAEDPKAPDTVTIDKCKTKKPAVEFPHKVHAEMEGVACDSCHHNDSVGKSCADCHKDKEQKDIGKCTESSPKKNPFHAKCIGCHKEKAADKPDLKAPTKCKDCHKEG
ncbi:MAG: cytochrome c3 family protein [Deltaproteobacteria bacterium]|nr:cytochrome c3 family protein [Deltaproteobacteria bacterium]